MRTSLCSQGWFKMCRTWQKQNFCCFSLLAKSMSQTFVLAPVSSSGSCDKKGVEGTVQKMGLVSGTARAQVKLFISKGS